METPTMQPAARRVEDEVRTLRRVVWAVTGILGVSLALNLALAWRVNRLSRALSPAAPVTPVEAGATVSPARVRNMEGEQVLIAYDKIQKPVVLYVFTPQCAWCAHNLANFQSLVSQKRDSYQFVGLSLNEQSLREYVVRNRLDLPVYLAPAEETRLEYGLGNTPQTIVISPGGKVTRTWVGAYGGEKQAEVEKFFGVKLPGLTPGP
jgi:peroxiredoxin